jgi:hypothetical protein
MGGRKQESGVRRQGSGVGRRAEWASGMLIAKRVEKRAKNPASGDGFLEIVRPAVWALRAISRDAPQHFATLPPSGGEGATRSAISVVDRKYEARVYR